MFAFLQIGLMLIKFLCLGQKHFSKFGSYPWCCETSIELAFLKSARKIKAFIKKCNSKSLNIYLPDQWFAVSMDLLQIFQTVSILTNQNCKGIALKTKSRLLLPFLWNCILLAQEQCLLFQYLCSSFLVDVWQLFRWGKLLTKRNLFS